MSSIITLSALGTITAETPIEICVNIIHPFSAGRGGTDTTGTLVQPTAGGVGVIFRTEVGDPCSLSFD